MSDPATFWAAKSSNMKSSQAPTKSAELAPAHIAALNDGLVLKGTLNVVKKSLWADSDDDEEFVKSFTLSSRAKELEGIVSAKDSRITDLTFAAKDKDARIAELESALGEQKQLLAALQSVVDTTVTQIAGLEDDKHKQHLHAQKLAAEAAEKDRRLASLETMVNEHRIMTTKSDLGEGSVHFSSNTAVPSEETHSQPAPTPVQIAFQHEGAETVEQVHPTPQIHATSQSTLKPSLTGRSAPANTSSTVSPTKIAGPAVNFSAFPVFVTPATVKQTTPPPPAPKLKMPFDLFKSTKKPVSKTSPPKKKIDITAKDETKDGPAPEIDPASDIRTKRREDRALFANGPKVQVKMGDNELTTLPKYILMQCSHKAFKYFSENPDATTFTLPADSMDETAAKAHLSWMQEMTYQGRVYSITLRSDEEYDDKNLRICRASRVLGLNNMYVGHFTKVFCDRIRSNAASYEFQDKIAALAYPDNDPLFDCLASNLAIIRARSASDSPAELEALLQQHASLKAKVEKINERMHKHRGSAKMAMGLKVIQVGKRM